MSNITVQGYQELQAAQRKLVEAMEPTGALGEAVKQTTLKMQKGVISRAHELTGTYKASQMIEVDGLNGRVYTAANQSPRGGVASVYGPIEEARGGSHAAYGATVEADAIPALEEAGRLIVSKLP